MHKEFSFFLLGVIAIGSGNKHVFPRLYPPITRKRKKGEFPDFFPKNMWELSVIYAHFQIDS